MRQSQSEMGDNDKKPVFEATLPGLAEETRDYVLDRIIFALAMGQTFESAAADRAADNGRTIDFQKIINATYTAAEILRRLNQMELPDLQTFVGYQAMAQNATKPLRELLHQIGISGALTTVRMNDVKAMERKVKQGWDAAKQKHSLVILAFDNVGFRIRGGSAGYKQYIVMQLLAQGREDILEMGGYQATNNQTANLRDGYEKRTEWDDIKQEEDIHKSLTEPTDDDIENLADVSLGLIKAILDSHHMFPPNMYDQCRSALLEARNYIDQPPIGFTRLHRRSVVSANVVATTIGECDVDAGNVNNADAPLAEDDTQEEVISKKTLNEANNATSLPSIPLDLNTNEAVKVLADFGIYLCKLQKEADVLADPAGFWENMKTITEKVGIYLPCDGNPTYALSVLKRNHPETYKLIKLCKGGFHSMKELICQKNKLTEPVHLGDTAKSWRKSDKQRLFFMEPSDPNQFLAENFYFVIGFYLVMIDGLIIERTDAGYDCPTQVSAVDVNNYVIKRAKEQPLVVSFLNDIRLSEIVLMYQYAEREANLKLYQSACKFSGPVYATTNATKYVSMESDELVEWRLKSQLDREIYEKFAFFRKTQNGQNIYGDRFVEWIVEEI